MKIALYILIVLLCVGLLVIFIFGPKRNLSKETDKSISNLIIVDSTTIKEVQNQFGRADMQFASIDPCKPEDFAKGMGFMCNSSMRWEKRKNLLATISLHVYYDNNGIVKGYEFKDNY